LKIEFIKGLIIMRKIYTAAWLLLTVLFLASVSTGNFNPVSLLIFSLIALGLVYAPALWAVVVNTKKLTP